MKATATILAQKRMNFSLKQPAVKFPFESIRDTPKQETDPIPHGKFRLGMGLFIFHKP